MRFLNVGTIAGFMSMLLMGCSINDHELGQAAGESGGSSSGNAGAKASGGTAGVNNCDTGENNNCGPVGVNPSGGTAGVNNCDTGGNNCAGGGSSGATGGGSSGATGGGSSGAAGAGRASQEDIDRLDACQTPEPCQRSFAQLAEGTIRNYSEETFACTFKALRERAPGRYRYDSNSTDSASSRGSQAVLVLARDGSVAVAKRSYESSFMGNKPDSYNAERCQLKPVSYFEGCLAALASDQVPNDAAWACVFGTSWFANCETEIPIKCE